MNNEQDESFCVSKGPCESCGSSDACGLYSDGHRFCFSCNTHFNAEGDEETNINNKRRPKMSNPDLIKGRDFEAIRPRKLTEETCRKFGYRKGKYRGKGVHIAEYRSSSNEVVAQHLRTEDKDFPWIGDKKKALLFGQQLWQEGGRKIVITEGEIDAMTVSQLQGHKWPVVSIKSGAAGAKKDLQEQIGWLETYEEIILMFDMDEVGQKAAQECAQMFTPGKAKIATLALKDANEMMLAGRSGEVTHAVFTARTYRPDFIIDADTLWEDTKKSVVEGLPLPFEGVSKATYGVRLHEIWTLLAGSGMGKTEVFKEKALHFAMVHNVPVALILLEEAPSHTALSISGKHINKRLHKPDAGWTEDEKKEAFDAVMRSEKVFVHNHGGDSDFDNIVRAIQYYVQAHGCQYIFLDHITAMAEGKGESNVNGRIHYIMEELNKLVQRMDCTIFLISHIRKTEGKPAEEGGRVKADDAYGSGAIKQRSNFIFALERDQTKKRDDGIDINTFRCLKDRNLGEAAGMTWSLAYDHSTGRLEEVDSEREFFNNEGEDDDECPF